MNDQQDRLRKTRVNLNSNRTDPIVPALVVGLFKGRGGEEYREDGGLIIDFRRLLMTTKYYNRTTKFVCIS